MVLAADEQSSHSQQLEVGLVEEGTLVNEHEVNNLNTHVKGFGFCSEPGGNLSQPSDEDFPHFLVDVVSENIRTSVFEALLEGSIHFNHVTIDVNEVRLQVRQFGSVHICFDGLHVFLHFCGGDRRGGCSDAPRTITLVGRMAFPGVPLFGRVFSLIGALGKGGRVIVPGAHFFLHIYTVKV